ncbi:hypothetical protein ABW20_dc0103890 [Dactylellina cionopaga]|nr:hypothetical protein ABW20_dc0103890 [Dactylellina cionopaga]
MAILPSSWFEKSKDSKIADTPVANPNAATFNAPPAAVITTDQPTPPPQPIQHVLTDKEKRGKDLLYKTAVVMVIAGPVLILMPPRKVDAYTFGLCFRNGKQQEHGHPGLLHLISPKVSPEYEEKMRKANKPYEGLLPSEAIWKQLTDVWNQRYDENEEEGAEEEEGKQEKQESMLERIRREESEKPQSEVLRLLAEQEKKRKS